jgi:hypothetical protein
VKIILHVIIIEFDWLIPTIRIEKVGIGIIVKRWFKYDSPFQNDEQ